MSNWVRALLFISIVAWCFPVLAISKEPPALSSGAKTLNILFLVDTSGSMQTSNKYLAVRSALKSLIANPSLQNANFGILTWGTGTCNWGAPVSCPIASYTNTYKWEPYCSLQNTTTQTPYTCTKTSYTSQPYACTKNNCITGYTSDNIPIRGTCNSTCYTSVPSGTYQATCYTTTVTGTTEVCTQRRVLDTRTPNYQYQWLPLTKSSDPNLTKVIDSIGYDGQQTQLDPPLSFIKNYLISPDFLANFNNSCATTLVIVLSDGYWNDSSTAGRTEATSAYNDAAFLYKQTPSIKTFAVAFGVDPTQPISVGGKNVYTFDTLAKAGGTSGGLGGTTIDAEVLAANFMSAIQSVMYDNFTTVPPTIIPKSTAISEDLILFPYFEYSPSSQWKGYLEADVIDSTGQIGNMKQEFGKNLNDLLSLNGSNAPDSKRFIWTAIPGLGGPSKNATTTPNNFKWDTTSLSYLTNAMETTGILSPNTALNDALNLVKFIRGYDVFDEDRKAATLTRWPLGDIYHSKPILVGKPVLSFSNSSDYIGGDQYFYNSNPTSYDTFKSKADSRIPVIYAGSNDGQLHAFNPTDGSELWSFIPPPLINKLKGMLSSQPNSSVSIYGVDGPLVARNIYINNEWRTYLAIALGKGARGFSVLDVTDPKFPSHVVSIENYIDSSGNRKTKKWSANGAYSEISGYETLGYTTSAPIFTFAKDGLTYEPVLVIGAGSSEPSATIPLGSSVFVISLKSGSEGNLITTNDLSSVKNSTAPTFSVTTNLVSSGKLLNLSSIASLDVGAVVSGVNIPAGTKIASINSAIQVTLSNSIVGSIPAGSVITFVKSTMNQVDNKIEVIESGQIKSMSAKYGFKMLVPNNNGFINSFDESAASIGALKNNVQINKVIDSGTSFTNDREISQPLLVLNQVADAADEINVLYGTGDDYLSIVNKTPDNLIVSIQDKEDNVFSTSRVPERNFSNFKDVVNSTTNECISASQDGWYFHINQAKAIDETGNPQLCTNGKLRLSIDATDGIATIPIYLAPDPKAGGYCTIGNSAILYRDVKCGYPVGNGGIYIKNTIVGGVVKYKDKVYFSMSKNKSTSNQTLPSGVSTKGNVGVLTPPAVVSPYKNPGLIKSKIRIH